MLHVKALEKTDAPQKETSLAVHHARGKGQRGRRGSRGWRGQSRGLPRGRGQASGYQGKDPFCDRCCRHHDPSHCRATEEYCKSCGEKGHYMKSPRCRNVRGNNARGRRNFRGRGSFSRGHNVHNAYENDASFNDYYNGTSGYEQNDYNSHNDYEYNEVNNMFDQCYVQDIFMCDVQSDVCNNMVNDWYYDENVGNCRYYEYSEVVDKYNDIRNNVDHNDYVSVNSWNVSEQFNEIRHDVFTVNESKDEWMVTLSTGGKLFDVEIDSGARCNIINLSTVKYLNVEHKMVSSNSVISGIGGNRIKACGQIELPCNHRNDRFMLNFQVVDTPKIINLLGRNDCCKLGVIKRVHIAKNENDSVSKISREYGDVLNDMIGCIPGEHAIKINDKVEPVVNPPRPVPTAIRDQVKRELDHLEKCGIITKVREPTDWVNAMVCVRKKNGRVRICIDPTELNKAILRAHYPMNTIEEVATRLKGSRLFSTLDANQGYYQLKLDDKSSMLTTFNTPFGRYRYTRMPMGLSCASEIFQREMVNIFGQLDGVEIVVDDLLVHGKDEEEHNLRLRKVLETARKHGIKLNKDKCKLGRSEVDYVGHKITHNGLMVTEERTKAIKMLRDPENHQELETILGMLGYVSKFIPNLSKLNAPLRALKTKEWQWGPEEKKSLESIKSILVSSPVLKYFDVSKPVTLTVDASTKGLGAAIVQEDGTVAYASRALTSAETRYAQIEREMLAVVFGFTRFHKLLYGKLDVTVESDHQPLERLVLKPMHATPMRIQKMRLKLQPYNFKLIYKKGKEIGLADCLSRFPIETVDKSSMMDEDLMVCTAETIGGKWNSKIEMATQQDPDLQALRRVILEGWPQDRQNSSSEVQPYWDFKDELSTYNGIVYKGERIVIPRDMRPQILEILHKPHLGIVRTKQRARDAVYWPGMNKQIEDLISKCDICIKHRSRQQKEPMTIHEIPQLPWEKVATDLFEYKGSHFMVIVDYFSNFIEVVSLGRDIKTNDIVKGLKINIARYGIMKTLVSDNGPQFSSTAFQQFTKTYGIEHITSSPRYPQSNGLAEKSVQCIKRLLTKCSESGEDFHLALLALRNTPRDDLESPMQRLMGRRAQTNLPIATTLLQPASVNTKQVHDQLLSQREKQKYYYDRGSKPLKSISDENAVRIRTPNGWEPAEYVGRHPLPNSHVVKTDGQNRTYRRNRRDLLATNEPHHVIIPQRSNPPLLHSTSNPRQENLNMNISTPSNPTIETSQTSNTDPAPNVSPNPIITSRSGRVIRKPARFNDDFVTP